jgi:hypothetical protein
MKPTRLHYFYAYNWPKWLWITLVPLACVALMAGALGPPPALLPPGAEGKGYLLLLGLAWLLGFTGGLLPGWFILGPIYFHRAQLNGAPFHPGDEVEILVGRCRGRVVRVLDAENWQGSVRVDLGEAERGRRSRLWTGDIFQPTQLLKVARGTQASAAAAEPPPTADSSG